MDFDSYIPCTSIFTKLIEFLFLSADHIFWKRQIKQKTAWSFLFEVLVACTSGPILREKGRDLTQSYDKSPYTHRKIQKATTQHKKQPKTSITQRLRTDFGRSVWGNDSHPTGE